MGIKSLGYMGFSVSDVPAWRSFLTEKVGLMEVVGSDENALYRMDSRSWRIAVERGEADDLAFAGYEVANPLALKLITERLREAGVQVRTGDTELAEKRGVMELVSFEDPFGMPLEIYYGATELFEQPFVSGTGVTGFLTGDQGAGHYFYAVPNIEEGLAFYTGILGFQMSDVIDIAMGPDITVRGYFLHCNGRHHTMAIAEAPLPKRVHHFLLQALTLDDVGHAYDRIDGLGDKSTDSNLRVPANSDIRSSRITATIGRHVNDHMISFYAETPSGFELEFGWGARDVDDRSWVMTRHKRTAMWGHKSMRNK
ncbi:MULTISPECIES: biphenyl-2,3-diol 1,2-dioxygenase [Pseudomonas]|uniref:Biphenyl-2,3-diol 1,2-dioxygenase n=4 Tax=Pseudomonas TaxID=286 RepID=A0A8I1EB91_9PSED|nr:MULTISPECIES: biphenyl-2,3-diol 1,2-dioxygenase [Pseudomonas]MBH2031257.1 biphenyl-2,3-diol 1,2-dioxygenase [Pseudomonadales bacterium]MBI6628080.1 biphenyl-2,3-diol 1,2-dioxygenase [Pseudomonas rhodesiae]MBH2075483.1 biphenyl-2,3-diol 1,2-dioxygenase [Pseudomonadales bacterium]MBI6556562.1 biphenyl-2,3-diol 1,2-dioxygenase [Pseudomonas veronii]MBI6605492.1 biphenyl-2,3-diol 1,2-dioxygenase [Pseudomonas sp. S4_EA_1b]